MPKRPETTQEWLDRYEAKYNRAFENYQSSGDPKYDRQQDEYMTICDALRAKLERENERGDELKRRMNNMNHATNNLIKDEYTRDEVIKLLQNAVWW